LHEIFYRALPCPSSLQVSASHLFLNAASTCFKLAPTCFQIGQGRIPYERNTKYPVMFQVSASHLLLDATPNCTYLLPNWPRPHASAAPAAPSSAPAWSPPCAADIRHIHMFKIVLYH
jgi:hypothetical protein